MDVADALDARSADYAQFIPVFGGDGPFGVELARKLREKVEGGFGTEVVILDRVNLAPAWRGLGGVGRFLTARLLRWVCSEPHLVLLTPFPIDLDDAGRADDVLFKTAVKDVRRVWRSLGFKRFTDDIWYMDPASPLHARATERLAGQPIASR